MLKTSSLWVGELGCTQPGTFHQHNILVIHCLSEDSECNPVRSCVLASIRRRADHKSCVHASVDRTSHPRLHARTHPGRRRWAMQPSTRGHRATARPSCMRACVRGCVRSVKTADKPSQRLTTFDRGLTNFVKPLTNVVKTTLTNLTMPIPWHARTHARTQAFTRVHADTRVNAHARGDRAAAAGWSGTEGGAWSTRACSVGPSVRRSVVARSLVRSSHRLRQTSSRVEKKSEKKGSGVTRGAVRARTCLVPSLTC